MDSVSQDRSAKHHQSSSHQDKPVKHYSSESKTSEHNKPSSSELLSSAKVLADAAKSTFSRSSDHKVDKAKVAHAAGDLLGAVSHYCKLEEKGHGKVIGQAENYLRKYSQNPDSTTTTTNSGQSAASIKPTANSSSHHSDGHGKSGTGSSHHSDGHGKSGSGSSDRNDGHEKSGKGYGDYIKMAEGLFKKH